MTPLTAEETARRAKLMGVWHMDMCAGHELPAVLVTYTKDVSGENVTYYRDGAVPVSGLLEVVEAIAADLRKELAQ